MIEVLDREKNIINNPLLNDLEELEEKRLDL